MIIIIKRLEDTKVWPHSLGDHIKCLVEDSNFPGKQFELTLVKEEFEIISMINANIPSAIADKFWNLIEDYGQMKYDEAASDAAIDAAGEDI